MWSTFVSICTSYRRLIMQYTINFLMRMIRALKKKSLRGKMEKVKKKKDDIGCFHIIFYLIIVIINFY